MACPPLPQRSAAEGGQVGRVDGPRSGLARGGVPSAPAERKGPLGQRRHFCRLPGRTTRARTTPHFCRLPGRTTRKRTLLHWFAGGDMLDFGGLCRCGLDGHGSPWVAGKVPLVCACPRPTPRHPSVFGKKSRGLPSWTIRAWDTTGSWRIHSLGRLNVSGILAANGDDGGGKDDW
jgi:hypothetical protein